MNVGFSNVNAYSYSSSFKYTSTQTISKEVSSSTPSQKVLGYEVDEKGYFKSDFNKAAGIPEDFKIHSDTMKSMVSMNDNCQGFYYHRFKKLDIAKTAGNAYKILTQIADKDTLKKDNFTSKDIAKIPQGYEYNRMSMKVTKIYKTTADYMAGDFGDKLAENHNTTTTFYNRSAMNFWNTPQGSGPLKPSTVSEVFTNNIGGKEGIAGLYFNSHGEKYKNEDGSITKAGILVGIMNKNFNTLEGETTWQGKLAGADKNISFKQAQMISKIFFESYDLNASKIPDSVIESLPKDFGEYVATLKKNHRVANGVFIDGNDSNKDKKTTLDRLLEEIVKNQKELMERLKQNAEDKRLEEEQRTQKKFQERLLEQSKNIDEFTKEFLKTQEELNSSLPKNLQTDITDLELKKVFSTIFGLNKNELNQKSFLDLSV